MIDLSHLTEEEQGAIMTVLRRDAELKKAEEERIGKLGKVVHSGSNLDSKWKYLTGEWFYEAKSRRHMDKIHGSEIILASMKQKKAALDGSLRIEGSKTPSSQGSDVVAPAKPARCLEILQQQAINKAEKENLNSKVRSPRTPRHNPFNRNSFIIYEPPETINIMLNSGDQDSLETEPISQVTNHPGGEDSQTSGGSITSESSSVGFKPVPKKRTLLLRHTSSVSESSGQELDAQVASASVVPAPRQSLQQRFSVNSSQDEIPQNCVESHQESQSVQPFKSPDERFQQLRSDVWQFSSNSSLEREGKPTPLTGKRSATNTRSDVSTETTIPQQSDELYEEPQRECVVLTTDVLHIGSIQNSGRENNAGTATSQEELSLPQSTVDPDPPVSYDLNFIDMSDEQMKKLNQKHSFKLTTQTTSPTGDEESIAKVLDWFSRSTDSIDLLSSGDGPKATKSRDKCTEVSKSRGEDLLKRDAENVLSDRLTKQIDEAKEVRTTDRIVNIEVTKRIESRKETRGRMQSQECEDEKDERQPPQISHLRSLWERNKIGPKILIVKAMMPRDKELKFTHFSANKGEENPSDMPSVSGMYNREGTYGDQRKHSNQEGYNEIITSSHRNSDLNLASHLQVAYKKESDKEILTRWQRRTIQSRLSRESESVSLVKSNPQPDSISQSTETPLQEELSWAAPLSQLDPPLQTRDSPDSEKLYFFRNSPYVDDKKGGDYVPMTTETQPRRDSSKDMNWKEIEDKRMQASMFPKENEEVPNRDGSNSPHLNKESLTHHESTADRIKQLKSFWEQERKPMFYNAKYKPVGDGKVTHGPSQARINKRFTKSEYDLRSIGNYSGSDEEDEKNNENVGAVPLNQRIEKTSPSTCRTQFNTLLEFWDEATSDAKPKSPKRIEPQSAQLQFEKFKCDEPESYHQKTRPALLKSAPLLPNRLKVSNVWQSGLRAINDSRTEESKKSSMDFNGEDKSTKPKTSSGNEAHPLKSRRDSFETSSSRAKSIRRAASMFALCDPDENDQSYFKMDVSPLHSQSRRQRQNTEKGIAPRRTPEEPETLIPLARACVPKDYRHYLGMTDETSVNPSLAPAPNDKEEDGKSGYEFELGGPVRTSTPLSSEERYSRRSGKMSQRPLQTNYSSDTGQESSVSSTSDTWSKSSLNRENINDSLHPIRKALKRAEAWPKNLAKSMEDITASVSPRQERRQNPSDDFRNISDASPSSSSFSEPDHLKKMSKSVPMLQKEDVGDTDSNSDNSYHRGRLTKGSSFTNSSGMFSLSGSVMTIYGGDFGNLEVQGNIEFSINYIQRLQEFHIFVAQCRDLAAVDPKRGRSDPYVKSYLFPDKANLGKRKTSVKKKTLNPTFNEILRYRVRMEYLRTQTLILSVWHHDTFGRNSFLGEVDMDLSKWDFDHTQMIRLALKARTLPNIAPSIGRGEMKLAIRYLPQIIHSEGLAKDVSHLYSGEIHIWVKECKNLPLIRAAIDPYVKCFVLPDTSRKSRQKTRVLRRTVDPVFNHTMVYDGIRDRDLDEACVELTVWDRDRLASNLLGGLRLGVGTGTSYGSLVDWMDSTPAEVALWERMKSNPNEWVEAVLPLRMLNSAKTASK